MKFTPPSYWGVRLGVARHGRGSGSFQLKVWLQTSGKSEGKSAWKPPPRNS